MCIVYLSALVIASSVTYGWFSSILSFITRLERKLAVLNSWFAMMLLLIIIESKKISIEDIKDPCIQMVTCTYKNDISKSFWKNIPIFFNFTNIQNKSKRTKNIFELLLSVLRCSENRLALFPRAGSIANFRVFPAKLGLLYRKDSDDDCQYEWFFSSDCFPRLL